MGSGVKFAVSQIKNFFSMFRYTVCVSLNCQSQNSETSEMTQPVSRNSETCFSASTINNLDQD
jgi:hypothetical protein